MNVDLNPLPSSGYAEALAEYREAKAAFQAANRRLATAYHRLHETDPFPGMIHPKDPR